MCSSEVCSLHPFDSFVTALGMLTSHSAQTANTTYGAVAKTLTYLSDRSESPRPDVLNVELDFPLTHARIVDLFRAKLREAKQQRPNSQFTDVPPLCPGYGEEGRGKGNKIVAVIDSIVSNPGVLLPWQEMVRVAHEEGVWTVIDAAHSVGQEVLLLACLLLHPRGHELTCVRGGICSLTST